MGDARVGGQRDGSRWASLLDPVSAAHVLAEVQAQAVRAASDLVDRLVRSVDGARERAEQAAGAAGAAGSAAGAEPEPVLLDGGAQLFVETWLELLQQAAASAAGLGAAPRREPGPARLDVVEGHAPPPPLIVTVDELGLPVDGALEIWLHNGTTDAVGPLIVQIGELRSSDGTALDATVSADPAKIDELPARSSRGIQLSITPSGRLAPGPHRTIVQVQGAPSVWLPVEVRVQGP